jgi:PIN domain nuclease of toxin-antitoxin system
LTPEILIQSSFLPGDPPRDPADRIIIATARTVGYRLVTRDRLLLAYAEAGHIEGVAC